MLGTRCLGLPCWAFDPFLDCMPPSLSLWQKQETNGGALYVDKDSSATFLGTSRFLSNTVTNSQANLDRFRNGGAVFNKVRYSTYIFGDTR